ncbi:MAG TPA: peptidoglycan recognition family protein [Clostridia bacterium]
MPYEIIYKPLAYNNPVTIISPVGGVAHDTESPGDSDESEYAFFNGGNRSASAHAFVDADSITQCIPWNHKAWHAGPTANSNRIGIEMCYTTDPAKFQEIWKRTTWLWAWLFVNVIKQPLNSDTLMSHNDVSNKWHETDHTDPVGYFARFGKTMAEFRHDIQVQIDMMLVPQWKVEGAKYLLDEGYTTSLHNPLEVVDIGTLGKMLEQNKSVHQ